MVLDRRMFRRPSQMAPQRGPSSKGMGITSGLTQPVQKFSKGDFAEKVRTTREELYPVLKEYFPEESFYDRAGMSPFKFLAALGSPMQPGQTALGKIGEAGQFLDIKPEGDPAGTLATDLALQAGLKTLEETDEVDREGFSSYEKFLGDGQYQRYTSFVENGQIIEREVGKPYTKEVEKSKTERQGFNNYEISVGDNMFQKMISFVEDGKVKNYPVGLPFEKKPTDEKSFEFEAKIEELGTLMGEAKDDDGNDLYSAADINQAKIDLISKQSNLTFDEEKELILTNLDAEGKIKWAEGQLEELSVDKTLLNQKEQNLTTRLNVLDAAITDPTLYDLRSSVANFFETFPGLKVTLGDTYTSIQDAVLQGQAVPTQALQTLTNQAILDVASGGAIPGNFNTKEFEAVIGAAGPAFLNRDAQEFIINLNLADVRIQKEVKSKLDELMADPDKKLLEVVEEVNNYKDKLYGDYRNSDEYAAGVNLLTGIGKAKKPGYFENLGNITIQGQELNISELKEENKISLVGYSDSNGSFTSPTGKVGNSNPNQPIYAVDLGDNRIRYYAGDMFP